MAPVPQPVMVPAPAQPVIIAPAQQFAPAPNLPQQVQSQNGSDNSTQSSSPTDDDQSVAGHHGSAAAASDQNANVVPVSHLQCFVCTKTWQFTDQQSRADVSDERSRHMSICHDVEEAHASCVKRSTIKVTEDDNVATLSDGRWLPYPSSSDLLCKKLPKRILPVTTDMDLHLVGLPLASKKPLEVLFDRTDNSLSLKMYSRDKLLSFEKLKKRKLEFVQGQSGTSITMDDGLEDLKTGSEAMQSIINYCIMANFVDACDKSPFALVQVAFEMYQARSLTPASAERLFSAFLNRKTHAAAQGRCYPGIQDIKQAIQFQFPVSPAEKEPKKTKPNPPAKVKKPATATKAKVKYCFDFNNGGCPRSSGSSCLKDGVVSIHGCNKKHNGVYCGLHHSRNDCTK